MFNNFFPRISYHLWDNVEYDTARQATDVSIIRCMRIECWITKDTDTLRKCNTYCFSTATIATQTRLSVMLYVHCLSCEKLVSILPAVGGCYRGDWCCYVLGVFGCSYSSSTASLRRWTTIFRNVHRHGITDQMTCIVVYMSIDWNLNFIQHSDWTYLFYQEGSSWNHDMWVPVTTAWSVLRLRMEEQPPDMEGSCEYIE